MSWAAGLLDGEACFRVDKSSPNIGVDSTSKGTVEELHRLLGGTCKALKRKTEADRPVFRWRVYGAGAREACSLLLPYLVEKKKQAEILIALHKFPAKSAMRKSMLERLSQLKRTV